MTYKEDSDLAEEDLASADGSKLKPEEAQSKKSQSRVRKFIDRRWWWFYSRYPNIIPNPYSTEEDIDYYRQLDIKENAATKLPADEQLKIEFIMAAELYGPREIENLIRGIDVHGWTNPDRHMELGDALEWLKNSRESGGFGGSFWLGFVVRKGDNRWLSRKLIGPVPEDFETISLYLLPITSSLTCVVATFNMAEGSRDYYEKILRQDRRTYHEPLGSGGIRIWHVEHLKERDINKRRGALRKQAISWFQETIPGMFTSNHLGEELVTVEFITTHLNEPFPKDHRQEPEWMRVLKLSGAFDAWECDDLKQLKLKWPRWRREDWVHGVAAMKVSDVPEEKLKLLGHQDRHAFGYIAQERLRDMLSRYAAFIALRGFLRNINTARDSIRRRSSSSKDLETVFSKMEDFFINALGVPSIVSELNEYASQRKRFERDFHQFTAVRTFRENTEPSKLSENLRTTIERLSTRIRDIDRSARELLLQYGSLLSTRESIKAQRTMKRLTVAALGVALLSAALAFAPLVRDQWRDIEPSVTAP